MGSVGSFASVKLMRPVGGSRGRIGEERQEQGVEDGRDMDA